LRAFSSSTALYSSGERPPAITVAVDRFRLRALPEDTHPASLIDELSSGIPVNAARPHLKVNHPAFAATGVAFPGAFLQVYREAGMGIIMELAANAYLGTMR
jgi:hypothetical protein